MSTHLLPAPISAEKIQLDLGRLASRLRRSTKLILCCAVLGAGGAWALAKTKPPYYAAEGEILVQGGEYAIPQLQGAVRSQNATDPMVLVRSETSVLTSADLLREVIDQTGLARMAEFNPTLRAPSLQSQIIGSIKSLLPGGDSTVADQGARARSEADGVLGSVMRQLNVFNDGRSLIISVKFTSEDPTVSANVVNTLIRDYTAAQTAGRNMLNKGANTALTKQAEDVHTKIDDLEAQIRELRLKNGLVALPAGSAGQQQLADLATAAAKASTDRAQAEALWYRANSLAQQGQADELAAVTGSSTVAQLRNQEAEAESRLATLTARFGNNYPDVQSARADVTAAQQQIAAEEQRIVGSLASAARVARQQESEAKHQVEQARLANVKTANETADLAQLQDEITAQRTLYQTLIASAQETGAQASLNGTPDIRVISSATPPGSPAGPNTHLAGLLGGLGGALIGCCAAIAFGRRESDFADAEAAAANTNLPVLAVLHGNLEDQDIPLAAHVLASPAGSDAEALRAMRTRLRLGNQFASTAHGRTVMFTSCSTEENAPGVAAAFARLTALDGDKVLLIEGNLRTPAMKLLLRAPGGNLVTVLESRQSQSWRNSVTRDSETSLDLLIAAQQSASSHALLSGEYLRTLIAEARDQYDWIVLDAPPAATSADAMSLARNVDATVLVVDDEHTTLDSVKEATMRLNSIAQNLAGLTLLQKA